MAHSHEQLFPFRCKECDSILEKLRKSAADDVTIMKRIVKSWFRGSFSVVVNSRKKKSVYQTDRAAFLSDHLNPFLVSLGASAWNVNTPLYVDWFIPQVLQLEPSMQQWSLIRYTSVTALQASLEKFIGDLKEQT